MVITLKYVLTTALVLTPYTYSQ